MTNFQPTPTPPQQDRPYRSPQELTPQEHLANLRCCEIVRGAPAAGLPTQFLITAPLMDGKRALTYSEQAVIRARATAALDVLFPGNSLSKKSLVHVTHRYGVNDSPSLICVSATNPNELKILTE